MIARTLLIVWCALFSFPAKAETTANEKQAQRIFSEVYSKMFGTEGAAYKYSISILGVYKTEGLRWVKGEKSKDINENHIIWIDGKNKYVYKKKKNVVEIYDAKDNGDKLLEKFHFETECYHYGLEKGEDGQLTIILKRKKDCDGMKEVRIELDKNRIPKRLRIKVAFFWANIGISNFKSGGIDDDIFNFPHEKYPQELIYK